MSAGLDVEPPPQLGKPLGRRPPRRDSETVIVSPGATTPWVIRLVGWNELLPAPKPTAVSAEAVPPTVIDEMPPCRY